MLKYIVYFGVPIWTLIAWTLLYLGCVELHSIGKIIVWLYFVVVLLVLIWGTLWLLLRIVQEADKQWGVKSTFFLLLHPLAYVTHFSVMYAKLGIMRGGSTEVVHDILKSLYFSVVTWATLGYGDFHPSEDVMLVAALEGMLGYLMGGILIGVLFKLVQYWNN